MTGASLYQILLALVTLYLVMRFLPGGEYVGAIILLAVFLSSPTAVSTLTGLLHWIEYPTG